MILYVVELLWRQQGAIGSFYRGCVQVWATNKDKAREQALLEASKRGYEPDHTLRVFVVPGKYSSFDK